MAQNTEQEFEQIHTLCLDIYEKKLKDYGTAWRLMRLPSLTDQLYIKARRIRTLEETGEARIAEGAVSEFIGLVNYSAIALIQCKLGVGGDIPVQEAVNLYNEMYRHATNLMLDKNHDYGEAWREMRVSSLTDIILTKLHRIKQIEDHKGKTLISEGVEAGYTDILVYSVFALIKLTLSDAE